MRFGGHETFSIREGWLHRGLRLLVEEPHSLVDEYAADWLGVGRNMAKAIRYWLAATSLSDPASSASTKPLLTPAPSKLGKLIWAKDPYFSHVGTLWALHINLVHNTQLAYTWGWFFNTFGLPRFDRALCVERLARHLRLTQSRMPTQKTLQREVACLLQSYARVIPSKPSDPEDAQDCPLSELGLLTLYSDSGTYRVPESARRDLPLEIFGYALASAFPSHPKAGHLDVTVREASTEPCSPGRVFLLSEEAVFDVIAGEEADLHGGVSLRALAGDQLIRVPAMSPAEWLKGYYSRVTAGNEADVA